MSHKKSIVFGFALFGLVVLTSISTFYASLGKCPSDSLSCDKGTKCVPQKFICDFVFHCSDRSDESLKMCNNLHGSFKATKLNDRDGERILNATMTKYNFTDYDLFRNFCAFNSWEIPEECVCRTAIYVGCKESHPPTSFPKDVGILYLKNISLTLNPGDSFKTYHNLSNLDLSRNNISFIPNELLSNLKRLRRLFLNSNQIEVLPKQIFIDADALWFLALDCNLLKDFDLNIFAPLKQLRILELGTNSLALESTQFPVMPSLLTLLLDNNKIKSIDVPFQKLEKLEKLSLRHNSIEVIKATTFRHLNLVELQLSENPIHFIDSKCFHFMTKLNALYLDGLNILIDEELLASLDPSFLSLNGIPQDNINFKAIGSMKKLKYVVFKKFNYCSKVPYTTVKASHRLTKICRPTTDGVSSSTDLLTNRTLRIAAVIMIFVTCIANLMVLYGRFKSHDENQSVSVVIKNLAVSDLIMSFYLTIITWHDFRFGSNYQAEAYDWIQSFWCILAGVLSIVSSEVTILILTFMSIERFLLISNPFGLLRLNYKHVVLSLFIIWVIGIFIAVFPVIMFQSSTRFYGLHNGGTCFPLFIEDTHQVGWEYSALIFFIINPALLIVIATLYTLLLLSVWRTRQATTLQLRDYEFAIRFFFIVLTDLMCWVPIIISKTLAALEYELSVDLYAWLIIFTLPLNSAVNPLLFTFTTPKYRDQIWMTFSNRSFNRKLDANSQMQITAEDSHAKATPQVYNSFCSSTSSKWTSFRKKS